MVYCKYPHCHPVDNGQRRKPTGKGSADLVPPFASFALLAMVTTRGQGAWGIRMLACPSQLPGHHRFTSPLLSSFASHTQSVSILLSKHFGLVLFALFSRLHLDSGPHQFLPRLCAPSMNLSAHSYSTSVQSTGPRDQGGRQCSGGPGV